MTSIASTTFVQELYQTILLRSGSTSDVNSWATLLDSGQLAQQQAISAFETSSEAVSFTDFVARMYGTLLDRSPDASGLSGWVDALRDGGVTALGMAEGFVGSQEFQSRYGQDPDFSTFVTALYESVLGRVPDAAGLQAWVHALTNHTIDYAGVALGFLDSSEFISDSTRTIDNWLTTAVDNAQAGASSPYPQVNGDMTKAVDSVSTGVDGGTVTIGTGGGWNSFDAPGGIAGYDSGSESVNLTASQLRADTLIVSDGAIAISKGLTGGVTGFVVSPNLAIADQFMFNTVGKTVLANNDIPTLVTETDDNSTNPEAAILLPNSNLANLTWTSSNGVITFGATSGHSVSEFTPAQLVAAAEIIVDQADGGGANLVAAFTLGVNTYVVASGNVDAFDDDHRSFDDNAVVENSVVELLGVSGITGFGVTAGQGTITDGASGNLGLRNASNDGNPLGATFNDTGFAEDILTNGIHGATNVFDNLAPSAVVLLDGGGNRDLGGLVTTQTGAPGANVETLVFRATGDSLDSATPNGDNTAIVSASGNDTIGTLTDPGNTLASVVLSGAGINIGAVNDTGLATIDGTKDTGPISLGGGTALSQFDLVIALGSGGHNFVAVTGQDTITTQGGGNSTIDASGNGVTILVDTAGGGGSNTITADGAGDTIEIGNGGSNAVVATGRGATISEQTIGGVANSGFNTFTVGPNAVVHLTSTNGTDLIDVHGDTAGTPSAFSFTAISGIAHGDVLGFNNATREHWLGDGGASLAQVNVSSATRLIDAVNLAGAMAVASTSAVLAPDTGVFDWFQFAGNTYIVESINKTDVYVPHPGLAPGDEVIELMGLFSPANNSGSGSITF